MEAAELLNAGQEYSEQFARFQHLLRGIRKLSDSPDDLPKSIKFLESTDESLTLSFVGKKIEFYHETDLPKTALWSKIMVALDEPTAKSDKSVKGFLRIDRAGNIKPDAAMSAAHTADNAKEVLMMLLELAIS